MKTLEELQKIHKALKKENKRIDLSISLNLCPICGAKIINQPIEVLEKPEKSFFGLVKIHKFVWDIRKICEKDKSHYEKKEIYYF